MEVFLSKLFKFRQHYCICVETLENIVNNLCEAQMKLEVVVVVKFGVEVEACHY